MNLQMNIRLQRGEFQLACDLTLEKNVTGIFGPSGAGKTTLLHLLAGLIPKARGRIVLDGRVLQDSEKGIFTPPHRRRIAVAFQNGRLFPHLTVEGNLAYGFQRLAPTERRLTFDEIVELLDLGRLLARRIHQLSGGERRRVALGRALLRSPRLLLLDEPLASLDPNLRYQILPFLRRVRDACDIPMLFVSHDLTEILELTREMVVLREGNILGSGAFLDLVGDPQILPLMHDLGLLNLIPLLARERQDEPDLIACRPTDEWDFSALGSGSDGRTVRVPLCDIPADRRLHVVIPAEAISLSLQRLENLSIQNQLPGRIERIIHTERRSYCLVDIGVKLLVEITARGIARLSIREGSPVFCLFKTHALRPLP